jgi:hypothetical protein
MLAAHLKLMLCGETGRLVQESAIVDDGKVLRNRTI